MLDHERVAAIGDEIDSRVAEVIDEAEAMGRGDPDEMFTDVFAEWTPRIAEQREYLRDLPERHGDDAPTREE